MPQRDLRSRIDRGLKALKNSINDADTHDSNSLHAFRIALERCRTHPAVIEACKFAGVDHKDPTTLGKMLVVFADARFTKRKGGTDEVWDSVMLSFLLRHYLRRVNQRPELADGKICAQMVQQLKAFNEMTPSTLRRRLRAAMDPKKNMLLKHLLANMEETSRAAARRRGMSLPDWRMLPDDWEKVITKT